MTKEIDWEKHCRHIFERYVDTKHGVILDPEFEEHINELRMIKDRIDSAGYPAYMYPSPLTKFMHYFNLPFEMKDFLRHYIVHDVIDYSLARSKISLICDYDNSYVLNLSKVDEDEYWESYVDEKQLRLVIPFGASITELKNFITAHQDFIKEKQQLIGERKKNSPRFNAKRDARVMQLVAEGKSYKQVAKIVTDEFGVPKSQGEIGVIVKRQRDSKK